MNGAQLGVAKEPLTPPKEGGVRGFFCDSPTAFSACLRVKKVDDRCVQ